MTIFSLQHSPIAPPPSPLLHTSGARVGVRRPPPLGAVLQLFPHVGALLLRFSPYGELILPRGGLFGTFFSLCGTYFTMWGPFWYIFLLMGNFFFTMWGSFFSMWGPLATFSSLLGPFFNHVGRQSCHVGDVLLRFSFYWELVLPCGGIFATFFSIWGAFLYIWGAFLYIRGAFL